MDSIPREGDKNYKKKRTLKLDGFDDDNEYYEAMSARIDYMDKNWARFKYGGDAPDKKAPMPSARDEIETDEYSADEKSKSQDQILSIGQRIFRTRLSCPGHGQSNAYQFNVWLHEFVKYIVFLFLMTSCTFSYTNSNSYYLTSMMKKNFIESTGFNDIQSVNGVWDWLDGQFVQSVYQVQMGYNSMVSLPRLRMQRVRPDSCVVHEDFQDMIDICYDSYSHSAESEEPISSVDIDNLQPGSTYTSLPGSIFGFDFWGQALPYLRMYYAGGYLRHLPKSEGRNSADQKITDARAAIAELKSMNWLSEGARILIIDLQYYNQNVNLFSIIRLAFEIPATGGVIPSSTFNIVHVKSASNSLDVYTVICEVLYILMIGYYVGEKIYEIRSIGFRFFRNTDAKLSSAIIILSCSVIIFKIVKYATIDTQEIQLCNPEERTDCYLTNFVFWQKLFENILAVITFLAWISVHKFFSDFESMAIFTITLRRCYRDLLSFIVVYMVTYLAYAQLGVLIFGGELDSFRNLPHSLYTLFRVILGDFDFHAMESANRIIGPLFFISYVFFVFFILLNMFLAIISDTYSEVKAELSVSEHKYPISEHVQKMKVDLRKKFNCYDDERSHLSDAIKNLDFKDEGQINWEKFRQEMLKSGVNDEEIRQYFERYDTDGNMALDQEEITRMQNSLLRVKEESQEVNKEMDQSSVSMPPPQVNTEEVVSKMKDNFASVDDFDLLGKRVAKMESTFSELTTKVDGIITKLDQIGQKQKQAKYDQLTTKQTAASDKKSKK
jgi:polycystin 2